MEDDVREEGAEEGAEEAAEDAQAEATAVEEGEAVERQWGGEAQPEGGSVHIETGRGATAEVQVGAPFGETIERIADEAHYGGYFRVFLNGDELLDPNEAPETIESGMRIAITSYDKVG